MVDLGAVACLGEVDCVSMGFSQLDAVSSLSKVGCVLIGFYQVAVCNLAQLLIIHVVHEEVEHFIILPHTNIIFVYFLGLCLLILNNVGWIIVNRSELLVPTDKEIVSV